MYENRDLVIMKNRKHNLFLTKDMNCRYLDEFKGNAIEKENEEVKLTSARCTQPTTLLIN